MRSAVILGALLAASTAVGGAAAQTGVGNLDLRQFHPPAAAEGGLYVETPTTDSPGDLALGLWLSYANQLLIIENADSGEQSIPLEHQYSVDYVASVGLLDWLSLGVAIPTVVYQSGAAEPAQVFDQEPPSAALGDTRFDLKANFLKPGTLGTLSLGALARATAPTSTERAYVGSDKMTGELRLLGQLDYLQGSLFATAGVRFREEVEVLGTPLGHDLPWGLGAKVGLNSAASDRKWSVMGEAHGSVGLKPEFADELGSPVLGGLSLEMAELDWSVRVGGEASVNGGLGGPRARAVIGLGYAPRVRDEDGDGIEDRMDQCPKVAEDLDGFEDGNGCPDYDNDQDGVSDTDDRCPRELEDFDDFDDGDGCPDPDNDGDGIDDTKDACPMVPGKASLKKAFHGCPPTDRDSDGFSDDVDRCPNRPEDVDGFKDDDGCPDRDNDRDRIPDSNDACPDVKGPRRSDPKLNGCPNPDLDGDALEGENDRCPKQAEDYDGLLDDDGCPDPEPAGKPLVSVVEGGHGKSMRPTAPIRFLEVDGGVEIDPRSLSTVRAMASQLNENPGWVLLVGVNPVGAGAQAEQLALNRSFAVVFALRSMTHRDDVAESVGFTAVAGLPGARADGVGFLVLGEAQK